MAAIKEGETVMAPNGRIVPGGVSLDLFVDAQRRRVVPNPAHPDQPVTKIK